MRHEKNSDFLETFILNSRGRRKQVTNATEEELKTLIECILNFEHLESEHKDKLQKRFSSLLEGQYGNLQLGRNIILNNLQELAELVEIVLVYQHERMICQILANG